MIAAAMFAFGVGLAVGASGGDIWQTRLMALGCYLACVSIVIGIGMAVAP